MLLLPESDLPTVFFRVVLSAMYGSAPQLRVIGACLAFLATFAVAAVPPGYAPVTDEVCSGSAANILHKLPRMSFGGGKQSGDLGSYDVLSCNTAASSISCSVVDPLRSGKLPQVLRSDDPTLLRYAQGPILYSALAIVLAVLSVLLMIGFIIGRYCCCCYACCCNARGCCYITMTCGNSEPTRRLCGCGVVQVEAPAPARTPTPLEALNPLGKRARGKKPPRIKLGEDPTPAKGGPMAGALGSASSSSSTVITTTTKNDTGSETETETVTTTTTMTVSDGSGPFATFAYPIIEKRLVFALLIIFLACTSGFILMGALGGFVALPGHVAAVAPALTSTYTPLLSGIVDGGADIAIRVIAQGLVPAALSLNSTLQSSVSLAAIDSSLGCLLSTVQAVPDVSTIMDSVRAVNSSLYALDGSVGSVSSAVDRVLAGRNAVNSSAAALRSRVVSAQTALNNVSSRLTDVDTALTPLLAAQTTLINAPVNLLPALRANMATLVPGAAGGSPASVDILAATGPVDGNTAGSGTLNRLLSRAMDGSIAEVTTLRSRLAALNATMATNNGPVDYNVTAARVTALLALISPLRSATLPALTSAINAAESALAAVPTSAAIIPYVNTLDAAAHNISFAGVLGALDGVTAPLTTMPAALDALRATLDTIRVISNIVPCARGILDQLTAVNASLLQLPDALASVSDYVDNINGTVADALAQVTSLQDALSTAAARVRAVNTSSYRATANSAWASVNASLTSFNATDIRVRLAALDGGVGGVTVNFTTIRSSISSLDSALASPGVSASTAAALQAFQAAKVGVLVNISNIMADLTSISGDGVFRCSGGGGAPCANDAACSAGTYCMPSMSRSASLRGDLWSVAALTSSGGIDAGNALPRLDSAITSANSVNGPSLRSDITAANSAISRVDTSGTLSRLDSVTGSSASYDDGSISSAMADVRSRISSAMADANSFTPQADDLNSTISKVKGDVAGKIDGGRALLAEARRQLREGLASYAAALSAPALRSAYAAGGIPGLLRAVANVAQTAVDGVWAVQQDLVTLPSKPNITEKLVLPERIDNAVGLRDLRRGGMVQWLLSSVILNNASKSIVATDDPLASGVLAGTDGLRYSGDRICVTDACIATTAKALLGTQQLAVTVPDLLGITLPSPAPGFLHISPVALLNMVWLFPAMVVVCGGFAAASRLRCLCRKKPRWEKCCFGCMTGGICCQLPACFLLAAMLFPAAMLAGDACASGRNVLYSAALQLTATTASTSVLCDLLPGDVATAISAGTCVIDASVTLPSGDPIRFSGVLSVPAVAAALIGSPGNCGGSGGPWEPFAQSALTTLRTAPSSQLSYYLGSAGSVATLRPNLLNVLSTGVNGSAGAAADALESLLIRAGGALTCDALSRVVQGTADSACCNTVPPLYWLSSAVFLIAWAYCCCGLPAGILGRKRLTTRPWGDYADPASAAAAAERARARLMKHSPVGPAGGVVTPHPPAGSATTQTVVVQQQHGEQMPGTMVPPAPGQDPAAMMMQPPGAVGPNGALFNAGFGPGAPGTVPGMHNGYGASNPTAFGATPVPGAMGYGAGGYNPMAFGAMPMPGAPMGMGVPGQMGGMMPAASSGPIIPMFDAGSIVANIVANAPPAGADSALPRHVAAADAARLARKSVLHGAGTHQPPRKGADGGGDSDATIRNPLHSGPGSPAAAAAADPGAGIQMMALGGGGSGAAADPAAVAGTAAALQGGQAAAAAFQPLQARRGATRSSRLLGVASDDSPSSPTSPTSPAFSAAPGSGRTADL